ncbi:MAG: ATP-binding protein [Verrucomicrobiaceae bacterium]|nr:ATP-binding protein [Verrucomicrobiaceae bacterium]
MSKNKYQEGVDASPTKEFFVEMLTRDISLEDAILDLLDNCVDGVLRRVGISDEDEPYKGYEANIVFGGESFVISDNCGGIPWSEHNRAFRQGRIIQADSSLPTVGTYGIGMKRAIYKIGRQCIITTKNETDTYQVSITPRWFKDETSWHLEAQPTTGLSVEGTTICISELLPSIKDWFSLKSFEEDLIRKIESHYAVILHKGFTVKVNSNTVSPKPISFRFSKADGGVRPYIFQTSVDGVEVYLTVGLRDPIPGEEQVAADMKENRFSTDYAGWTVICNDRVVLYCNKDEQTGWGEATVPQYHTQFIAISGVVEFRSNDARALPTTTTKRGLDQSSRLYAQVKNRMREGMKLFTAYTNNWKAREAEAKAQVKDLPSLTFAQVKAASKSLNMAPVRSGLEGHQYKPELPRPKADETDECRISFRRERAKVEKLAKILFGNRVDLDDREMPKRVGEECFDSALQVADKKA